MYVFVLLLGVGSICQASETSEVKVIWQSQNRSMGELSKEFAKLYASLLDLQAAGSTVPTVDIAVPRNQSIQEVLQSRSLFAGSFFPRQLDVFVCRLNPEVCTVRAGASGKVNGDDAVAIWRIQANQTLSVPNINVKPVLVHRTYLKSQGVSLKSIVVDERQGCDSFDDACATYVKNLNRRIEGSLDDSYSGEIVVPTKAYRAVIPIRTTPGPSSSSAQERLVPAAEISRHAPAAAARSAFEEPARPERATVLKSAANGGATAAHGGMRREVLEQAPALTRQVVPPSAPQLHQSDGAATGEGTPELIAKLIHLDPQASKSVGAIGQSNVAVFDTWVDSTHCLLNHITIVDGQPAASGSPGADLPQVKCGERGATVTARDHGTHVVGVIAAKPETSSAPGVNPRAVIVAVRINPDDFVRDEYLTAQTDRLNSLYRTSTPPDVVNLSFEYRVRTNQGGNDPFREAMRAQERNTLFVVSAGNQGQVLASDGSCPVRPACYGQSNVIAVGALDLDDASPKLLSLKRAASNYGDRVHVAAPGLNIVSTIAGNRTGAMSGTSQAAPLVTGAASLLYLREHRLRPGQVKNRLIYTSDLFPDLYDKLLGGRLNVARALDYQKAVVRTFAGPRIKGDVRDSNKLVYLTDEKTEEKFAVSFGQIRRLVYDAKLKYYTLFYNEDSMSDAGDLRRRFVLLRNDERKYAFAVSGLGSGPRPREQVRLMDIEDYTSALQF